LGTSQVLTSPSGAVPNLGESMAGRFVRRLGHRSRGGSERDLALAGVPVCRRCTMLTAGLLVGAVAGVFFSPAAWIVVLVCPLAVDVMAEKVLGLGHRPLLVAAGSALAGVAVGATVGWVMMSAGLLAGLAILGAAWVLALGGRVVRRRRHRSGCRCEHGMLP